jgi:hypothetical protein
VGVSALKRGFDCRPDTLWIAKHIVIPKSHYAATFVFDDSSPISIDLLIVLPTIDLNDQSRLMRCEIHDEMADWNLTTEARFGKGPP